MSQTEPTDDPAALAFSHGKGRPRWRFRWTIRTLLLLMALVAALLAWLGRTFREAQLHLAVIRELEEAGAAVYSAEQEDIEPNWNEIVWGNWQSIEACFFHTTAPEVQFSDELLLRAGRFQELQGVSLHGQPISDRGVGALRNKSKITQLSIHGCDIGDPSMSHLATLENLEELELYGVRVTAHGVRQLRSLSKLKSLHLRFTLVSEEELEEIQRILPHCAIWHEPSTGAEQVDSVIALARHGGVVARDSQSTGTVVIVHGDGNRRDIDWKALESFPDLESFGVHATPVNSALLRQLATHQRLASITFGNCQIPATDLKLLESSSSITHLRLHGGDVSDEHLAALGRFASLEVLDILGNENPISRAGIESLTNLKSLRTLRLLSVTILDSDIEPLPRLENLKVVDLSYTPVTDSSLAYLLQIPKLEVITLDSTKITGSGAQRIMNCPRIKFADWHNTGILPESFARPTPP